MAVKKEVDKIWEKGKTIKGKNPNLYRKDSLGNNIYKPAYGKGGKMGWEIDHKKPLAKKGTDTTRNKRPLQTKENRKKSDKYPSK